MKVRHATTRLLRLILTLTALISLNGCGQNGELFLPGEDAPPVVTAPEPAADDDEQESEADDEQ